MAVWRPDNTGGDTMTMAEMLVVIRRYLRDPSGNVWGATQLIALWNQAQIEVAQKTGALERAHLYRYPPWYTWLYQWDWEYASTGDTASTRVMGLWQRNDYVISYPWEGSYSSDSVSPSDDGYRITYPLEAEYGSPADPVKFPLHEKFDKMKFCAFDEVALDFEQEREISKLDPFYKTTVGQSRKYYLPDIEGNTMVLYPRPSAVTWDEDDVSAKGNQIIVEDTGEVVLIYEDYYDISDVTYIYESMDLDGHLFMIFDSLPDDVVDSSSTLVQWPPYMRKAIICALCERAYSADTDGFVPSLRDYWKMRKEDAIAAINIMKRKKVGDRDYRLGGTSARRISRLRLPSGYPEVWP